MSKQDYVTLHRCIINALPTQMEGTEMALHRVLGLYLQLKLHKQSGGRWMSQVQLGIRMGVARQTLNLWLATLIIWGLVRSYLIKDRVGIGTDYLLNDHTYGCELRIENEPLALRPEMDTSTPRTCNYCGNPLDGRANLNRNACRQCVETIPELKKEFAASRNAYKRRQQRLASSAGHFTPSQWIKLKHAYGYHCLRCGECEPVVTLVPDHVIPLAKNGANDITNIQPLCLYCNSKKGTQTTDYRVRWQMSRGKLIRRSSTDNQGAAPGKQEVSTKS